MINAILSVGDFPVMVLCLDTCYNPVHMVWGYSPSGGPGWGGKGKEGEMVGGGGME